MHRQRSGVFLGLLVLVTLTAGAPDDGAASHRHTDVEGTVFAEAPHADVVRCVWLQAGDDSQGVVGWVVRLGSDEGDGEHRYELAQDGILEDLDITFYADLGACPGGSVPIEEDESDREWTHASQIGTVPAGSRYAVIGRWNAGVGGPTYAIPPFYAYTGSSVAVDFQFSVHHAPVQGLLAHPFDGDAATTQSLPATRDLLIELSRARFGWKTATHAVLTRTDRFADALAGAPLTADGPLLGSWGDRLPADVAQELRRALPKGATVYLLGGTEAIPENIERDVQALGFRPHRLDGRTRIETAIAVADVVRAANPDGTEVGLARATGSNGDDSSAWADSVTAGAFAAARRMPILLTATDDLHPSVAEWVHDDQPRRTLLFGGHAALSARVEAAAPNAVRFWGTDRAGTAARIAEELRAGDTTSPRRYVIVNGWSDRGWLWGTAAAGLGHLYNSPILLVSGNEVPEATARLVSTCGPPEVDLFVSGRSDGPAEGVTDPAVQALDRLDGSAC